MNYLSDMRLLQTFVAVFRQKSISGAARILNCTQPTVTRSIHNLENELGNKLFYRTPDGLIPTDFSNKLFKRALSILDEVNCIFSDSEEFSLNSRNIIHLGVGHGCCLTVNSALVEYRNTKGDTVFNTRIASARNLLSESENGIVDVIVGNHNTLSEAKWLTVKKYIVNDRFIVARRSHPVFSLSPDQQIGKIKEFPNLTYHLLEDSIAAGVQQAPGFRVNDHLMLLDLLAKTDSFTSVNTELLPYLDYFNIGIVGSGPIGKVEYSIAYSRNITHEALDLVNFMLNRESI